MRIRFIISPFPFPNFKYLICRYLLTCVRINIYKVISRDDYILLWFTFYVNWHLSNSRYHILPYHVDTYGGFVEFPQNGVYFNWSVFWSIMVNPRFFIKHLCWCYYHPILQPIFLYPMATWYSQYRNHPQSIIIKIQIPNYILQHPCIHVSWYKWCGVIHNKYFNLSYM